MKKLNERSKKNLQGIHPSLISLMEAAIAECPVDFTITCGVRTTAEQQQLYSQGRTASGPRVTNCDGVKTKSNHQIKQDGFGHAVDLYPIRDGKVQVNDVAGLKIIADHIKKTALNQGIKISWGGDWKMKDYPHFELKA